MARRIEIELTSSRPDGSWTWRAAGAREPRGVVEGSLLPAGAKAGDVLRAEADFEIDGINIVSVLAPKESSRPEPERIEIIGSGRSEGPAVTTQLVGRSDRRPGDRRRDRDEARPRRDREGARPTGRDTTRPRREGPPTDDEGTARPSGRPGRGDRGPNAETAGSSPDSERLPRSERRSQADRRDQPSGPRREGDTAARGRPAGSGRGERVRPRAAGRETTTAGAPERRTRRLTPGRTHRQAILASLPPEQQPVAEQVLRGGIPAVRTALHLEREKAMAEGRPVPNTDQLVAMAESLLPRLKAAEWRDRAEAADKDVDEISLRDLRSVVAGADMARDDETRALAARLRDALDRRVEALRSEWSEEIARHLDDHKVVRALRLAARPPEPAARLDAALAERLSAAAGQALAPDAPAERWLALLEAVAASPVRRSVQPAGLPTDATPEVRRAAHQQSGRIPALAALLGTSMPPPPPVAEPTRKPSSRRRSRGGEARGAGPAGGDAPAQESPPDQAPADGAAAGQPADNGEAAPGDRASSTTSGAAVGQAGNPATPPPAGQAGDPADQPPADQPPADQPPAGRVDDPADQPPADQAGNPADRPEVADTAGSRAALTEPAPTAAPASAERAEDAVVVEEFGQSVDKG